MTSFRGSPPATAGRPFNWSMAHELRWHEADDGRILSNDGRYQVERTEKLSWLRRLKANEAPETLWIHRDPVECMVTAGLFAAHDEAVDALVRSILPLRMERPTHVPGIRAVAHMRPDMPGAHIASWGIRGPYIELGTEDNRRAGSYSTAFTKAIPSYVIGEIALCGSAQLYPELIGRGLGRLMYDLAEEVSGLPLVPHGENLVDGIRTEYSRRFWERRAQFQRVPGISAKDAAMQERLTHAEPVYQLIENERFHLQGAFAVEVASHTDWPIETVWHDDAMSAAWCVTPDGKAFSARGFEDREQLLSDFPDGALKALTPEQVVASRAQEGSGFWIFDAVDETRAVEGGQAARLLLEAMEVIKPGAASQLDKDDPEPFQEKEAAPVFGM